jgi:protein-S-isoprenylcysteine O-methyltransferase Ste14
VLPHKYWIDSHKGLTGPYILGLIAWYHAWDNVVAWIYLGMHGTYGILWILKSRYFGDKNWERPVNVGLGLGTWLLLSLYWIAPWMIVAHRGHPIAPWMIGACVALYSFGVFLHFASDMQKHMSMAHRRGTLLTDGLWSLSRNPNYLGELCIYVGFTALAWHWLPIAALGFMVAGVWIPNMRRKDRRLSRYPEFAAYKANTKLLIPYLV